jgi:hypothetical protein
MNRADRRRSRSRARRKARENRFYQTYIRHLPAVPIDAPLEPGRVYHTVFAHDDWCEIYSGRDCNCSPIVRRFVEPRRS